MRSLLNINIFLSYYTARAGYNGLRRLRFGYVYTVVE